VRRSQRRIGKTSSMGKPSNFGIQLFSILLYSRGDICRCFYTPFSSELIDE
jgi:hypothetical protein